MRRTATIALTAFLFAASCLAQSPENPTLVSSGEIHYPPIAKAAHVEGDVTVSFTITMQGTTSDVAFKSGPVMLQAIAVDAVKVWRFAPLSQAISTEATFHFRLNPPPDGYEEVGASNTTVELRSLQDIKIVGVKTTGLNRDHCPSPEERLPPAKTDETDFVELFRSSCMGTCPAYTVRVHRDGKVEWDGNFAVKAKGHVIAQIPHADADALLKHFQVAAFWQLCGDYTDNGLDGITTGISVGIGGRKKTLSVHDDSAPPLYETLELEIDRVANTHQWRHGDPRNEPLDNIGNDTYMPKPGVTDLMRVAGDRERTKEIRPLLASGADVNAVDSSGWTSLMYASRLSVTLPFLEAGANPNYQSPHGDTALMVSALEGSLDEDLLKHGADINLQNRDGATALMFLASYGNPDEIVFALHSGAKVSLRDSKGRTALDYLRLANCGKSPVPRENWDDAHYTKCTALHKDDFKKSEKLLKAAMHSRQKP